MKRANGMGTIIKLSGNRRKPWAIRRVEGWREDGRPIIKYQGYYRKKSEAEAALLEYNNDPYTMSNKTFKEIYREWYKTKEVNRTDKTLGGYRTTFKHLAPLHDMKISDINREVLQRFYDDLEVNAVAFQNVTKLINMVFGYAVKRGILPTRAAQINKTVVLPSKKVVHQAPRTCISDNDIEKLWKLKDDNEYAKIILVYLYTGLRYSELYNLTADCCHANYIEIRKSKTKAGVRIVPICDKLQSVLPIIQVPPRSTFERRFKELLPDHRIHETRHTFITRLAEKGVDARVIKAIVGHKSSDVTEQYTHMSLDAMLAAVNLL